MTLKIYLARHGQDEDNAAGILNGHRNQPLTKLGEEQAEAVARKIMAKQLKFDAIYSSPLRRAHRTAEILACNKPDSVEIMDLLIERDFGVMTGVPTKEIKKRCAPDLLQTDTISYFLSPEGAETFDDLLERGSRVISKIQEIHKEDSSILLVTHGDFGKMLYAAYYKLDWVEVLKQFHFGNSEVLLLSPESSPELAHVFQIEQHNP